MKLLKSSGPLKKPNLFLLRRVYGESMLPAYQPRQIVLAIRRQKFKPGDVIIFEHNGLEKMKRVTKIDGEKLFVVGDNRSASTDSRQFGWLTVQAVRATVVWPAVYSGE